MSVRLPLPQEQQGSSISMHIYGMPTERQEWPAKGEQLVIATKKLRWETAVPVLVPGDGGVVVFGGGVVVPGKGGKVVGAGERNRVKHKWRRRYV